jgi:hypothetical protein
MARTSFGKMLTKCASSRQAEVSSLRRQRLLIPIPLQYLPSHAFAMELQLEQCFATTRRLRAIWEEVHDVGPFLYAEVQLAVFSIGGRVPQLSLGLGRFVGLYLGRCSAQISVAYR